MAETKKKKHATFRTRLLAWLIDLIIVATLSSVSQQVPFLPFGRRFLRNFGFLVGALYSILLWVNWNGQTVGKKLMKIKVVGSDSKALDYKKATIRYIGYIISSLVFFLGYLWVLWDEKKQGWHDKIAGTYVVEE